MHSHYFAQIVENLRNHNVTQEHRVLIPELELQKRSPRQSIAFFVFPDDDVMVTPRDMIAALIGSGPMTCKEYYDRRMAVTQRAIRTNSEKQR